MNIRRNLPTRGSRRGKLIGGTVAAVAAASVAVAVIPTTASATPHPSASSASTATSEQAQLQALYQQAKAAGGEVTVYMGGDAPGQWDSLAQAFEAQFPDVKLHLVTDLSKYLDARIDNQIATHHPVADVAILQTTDDFDRWKSEGRLLRYKPVGYSEVYQNAKDPQGYWTGVFYGAFSYIVNNSDVPADPSSFNATDLLQPQFKGKIILTYPDDDDAVLFGFKQIVDKYGWGYLGKLMAQDPAFVRGVPGSAAGVASGKYLASIAVGGDARPNGQQVFSASETFNTWVQHGAILQQSQHKAAAELFLSWITSQQTQKAAIAPWTWSVRSDVTPPTGLKPLATYRNTNPSAFSAFMSDRAAVEAFRAQVALYVGQPQGVDPADPTGTLGLDPGAF